MQRKSFSRISMVAIPILIVCGLLVPASSMGPTVRADNEETTGCTNKTLQGDYGFALEGEILGPGLQFRGVVMTHFDGNGNFTQVDHIVFNGVPAADGSFTLRGFGSGDYRVSVSSLPPGVYAKSVRYGNVDVLNGGFHLSGPPQSPLEIVVGTKA